jgi:hypothetical protein
MAGHSMQSSTVIVINGVTVKVYIRVQEVFGRLAG